MDFKVEPKHDKTKKMTRAPGLISVFVVRSVGSYGPKDSEDSDQTGQMRRLIWVFAGRICYFVGFVMLWLNLPSLIGMPYRDKIARALENDIRIDFRTAWLANVAITFSLKT